MKKVDHSTIKLASDRLSRTLSSLEASGKITTDQAQKIRWFYVHARDNRWTYEQAAAVLSTTTTEAFQLFDGHLLGGYQACCDSIAQYHARINAEHNSQHFENPTFKKIDDFCFAVRSMKSVGFIISASQIGKTENMMEVKRRDTTGRTLMIRCPASPSLLAVYAEIARAMHIPYRSKDIINLRYRILEGLDDYDLVFFDELHQAFLGTSRDTTIKVIESLRGLYDYKAIEGRKIGMIFCGTTVLQDEMGETGDFYLILEQFRRRSILKLILPPTPPIEDAYAIAKAFSLPRPDGDALRLVRNMLQDSGIGQYIYYLRSASIMAASDNRKIDWDDFLAAYDIIDNMSWKDPKANVVVVNRNNRKKRR